MVKKLVMLFLVLVVFVSACTTSYTGNAVLENTQESICNKPYIEYMSGKCCLDADSNMICDVDEKSLEQETEPLPEPIVADIGPQEDIVDSSGIDIQNEAEFKIHKGNSVNFNGKTIRIIDFDNSGKTDVAVDGVIRDIKSTRYTEIINEVMITILSFDINAGYLTLKAEVLQLGDQEYLVFAGNSLTFNGKRLILRNVNDDGSVLIDIENELYKDRVLEGETKAIDGFWVTNINSWFRDALAERYSILKIIDI